jgi:hypothetical protein
MPMNNLDSTARDIHFRTKIDDFLHVITDYPDTKFIDNQRSSVTRDTASPPQPSGWIRSCEVRGLLLAQLIEGAYSVRLPPASRPGRIPTLIETSSVADKMAP